MPTDLNGLEFVGDVLQRLRAFKPLFSFPQLFLTSINDVAVSTNVVVQALYVKWYPPTWRNIWFTSEHAGKAKGSVLFKLTSVALILWPIGASSLSTQATLTIQRQDQLKGEQQHGGMLGACSLLREDRWRTETDSVSGLTPLSLDFSANSCRQTRFRCLL